MNRFAGSRSLTQIVPRLISRHARACACVRASSSRAVAALAAAVALFAAQPSIGFGRGDVADAPRTLAATPTASPLVALHAVPAPHLAPEARSSARWPSNGDVLLPANADHLAFVTIPRDVAIVVGADRAGARLVARGYDATAPPARI